LLGWARQITRDDFHISTTIAGVRSNPGINGLLPLDKLGVPSNI
jgi:hypothetical protein